MDPLLFLVASAAIALGVLVTGATWAWSAPVKEAPAAHVPASSPKEVVEEVFDAPRRDQSPGGEPSTE